MTCIVLVESVISQINRYFVKVRKNFKLHDHQIDGHDLVVIVSTFTFIILNSIFHDKFSKSGKVQ